MADFIRWLLALLLLVVVLTLAALAGGCTTITDETVTFCGDASTVVGAILTPGSALSWDNLTDDQKKVALIRCGTCAATTLKDAKGTPLPYWAGNEFVALPVMKIPAQEAGK